MANNPVKSPTHYASSCARIEPIEVLRYSPFCVGNALKYVIRAGKKDSYVQDLQKARQYMFWAQEDYAVNPSPTDAFFTAYGALLRKFERLEQVADLDTLSDVITALISADRMAKVEEVRLKKAEYSKQYYQNNREKMLKQMRENYAKKKQELMNATSE